MKRVRDISPLSQPSRQVTRSLLGGLAGGFSTGQLRKLAKDVDPRHVHTRELDGRQLSYIEGWYAIAQANEIFGYAGWDREMIHFERIMERPSSASFTCGYLARVRIRVRASTVDIVREGTGWGSASASSASAANERALKAAETDATKRALATFGGRFGLKLYDKANAIQSTPSFKLYTPDGTILTENLSPEGYSTGLRQLIELCRTVSEIDQLSRANSLTVAELRTKVPELLNAHGTHFSDLLLRLLQRRREQLSAALSESGTRYTGTKDINGATYRYVGQANRRRQVPIPAANEYERTRVARASERTNEEEPSPYPDAKTSNRTPSEGVVTPDKAVLADVEAQDARRTQWRSAEAKTSDIATEMISSIPVGDYRSAGTASEATPVRPITEQDRPTVLEQTAHARQRIDKSELMLPLERRLRDKSHLRRLAELPCLICSRQPSHAHHLRFAQRRGMSQKVSDEYTVPLCSLHHGDLHRSTSEPDWWHRQNIDPIPIAAELWRSTLRAGAAQ